MAYDLASCVATAALGDTRIDEAKQKEVIEALRKKNVDLPCPRCKNTHFQIVGWSYVPITEKPSEPSIAGPVITTVLVACSNCGYLFQHAQSALGLVRGVSQ